MKGLFPKFVDADGLSGFLYIHVQNGKSFSKTAGKTIFHVEMSKLKLNSPG